MSSLLCCLLLSTFDLMYVNAYERMGFNVNKDFATEHKLICNTLASGEPVTKEALRGIHSSSEKPELQELYEDMKNNLHRQLYGEKVDRYTTSETTTTESPKTTFTMSSVQPLHFYESDDDESKTTRYHYPNGQALRAELFNNKSRVHFPPRDFIYEGYALLNVTNDYMQTAINAFAILLEGTVADVQKLPADYILSSARTIAMMKITRDKLAMLWTVLKGDRSTAQITYEELEMYRPLFKYVNAREIGRLNLKDEKILNFIGTHADLDRHQVGVVASKYITQNPNWTQVRYLNHMNNLLCGVPMNFMRKIQSEIYLQLSHQVFYHVRACEPLQRRFFLAMMTRTEALGMSYSWSAHDVSRLGLLLAEVEGPDLAAINPEAMSGITAQVMMEIPPQNLQYLTEVQVEFLSLKSLTVFARKVKAYSDSLYIDHAGRISIIHWSTLFLMVVIVDIIF